MREWERYERSEERGTGGKSRRLGVVA